MMGPVTIRYKARMSWTTVLKTGDYKHNEDVLCNVVHEVSQIEDGTWITVSLDWTPCDGLLVKESKSQ